MSNNKFYFELKKKPLSIHLGKDPLKQNNLKSNLVLGLLH